MSWMNVNLQPPAPESVHHLLHLYHSSLVHMPLKHDQSANADNDTLSSRETSEEEEEKEEEEEEGGMTWAIPSASVLQKAGVEFKQMKKGTSILDVKFNNGIITIPSLLIDKNIHSLFRNLIAFEQFFAPLFEGGQSSCNFTGYLDFMHYIIDMPKDIALLKQNGILKFFIGGEEHVAHLFNSILNGAVVPPKHYLSGMYKEVNKYCKRRRHRWRASLMHNHFNSPWAVASVVAAVILLLLTFVQTFFSVYTAF